MRPILSQRFSVVLAMIVLAELVVLRIVAPSSWFNTGTVSPSFVDNLTDHRRSVYDPHSDPKVGKQSPKLAFWDSNGQKVKDPSLRRRRIALLFVDSCTN